MPFEPNARGGVSYSDVGKERKLFRRVLYVFAAAADENETARNAIRPFAIDIYVRTRVVFPDLPETPILAVARIGLFRPT